MLGVNRLLCGTVGVGDPLRYGRKSGASPAHLLHYSEDKKPIVVWTSTRRCNLHCAHCYAESQDKEYAGELTTSEAHRFIDDITDFGCPVILFSGGEPTIRPDLFELATHAHERNLRTVISTNGTLIDEQMAQKIKDTGFSYVGVSLDGIGTAHDRFRGTLGAFDKAMRGIRNCRDAGVRVGLRFTITKLNQMYLSDIFDLIEQENIPRCCVYHLAYAGRGSKLMKHDLTGEEARAAVTHIFDRSLDFHRRGLDKEILTVDNHADGPFLYMRVLQEQPKRAEEVLQLLRWNGGNASGIAVSCVDNLGNVHADQFWQHYSFGNVRERKFGEIWTDRSDPLMAGLKDRKHLLKGRCPQCRYLDICNGNLRVRAEAATGDVWGEDPACYLTDEEIGLKEKAGAATRED